MIKSFELTLINILITFQLIISSFFGVQSLYYLFGLVFILISVLKFRSISNKNKPLVYYFIYLICVLFINLIFNLNFDIIIYFISINWILFYLFFKTNNDQINIKSFLKWNLIISIFVAFGGFIEYHLSRDIFGLVPQLGFKEFQTNFEIYYRTRSFVWSQQINSLILTFAFLTNLEFKLFKNILRILIGLILIYAIVLTGAKVPVFCLLVYFILKISKSILSTSIAILFSLILFNFISNNDLISENRQLSFIFQFDEFIKEERSNRFSKQINAILDSNIIFGNGIGSTNSNNKDYINTESFYIQLFSEFGIFGLLFFIIIIYKMFRISDKSNKLVLLPMIVSGFIVHGLSSPYLFPFWVLLFDNSLNFNKNANST